MDTEHSGAEPVRVEVDSGGEHDGRFTLVIQLNALPANIILEKFLNKAGFRAQEVTSTPIDDGVEVTFSGIEFSDPEVMASHPDHFIRAHLANMGYTIRDGCNDLDVITSSEEPPKRNWLSKLFGKQPPETRSR